MKWGEDLSSLVLRSGKIDDFIIAHFWSKGAALFFQHVMVPVQTQISTQKIWSWCNTLPKRKGSAIAPTLFVIQVSIKLVGNRLEIYDREVCLW